MEPGPQAQVRRAPREPFRLLIAAESVIYYAIAVLLLGGVGHLLVTFSTRVATALARGEPPPFSTLLDQLLLVLMLVEILHTVRVSLGERRLSLHPFLVVGVIASVRQILKLPLEMAESIKDAPERFALGLAELGVHGALILVLVFSIWLLSRCRNPA